MFALQKQCPTKLDPFLKISIYFRKRNAMFSGNLIACDHVLNMNSLRTLKA